VTLSNPGMSGSGIMDSLHSSAVKNPFPRLDRSRSRSSLTWFKRKFYSTVLITHDAVNFLHLFIQFPQYLFGYAFIQVLYDGIPTKGRHPKEQSFEFLSAWMN
jgi:hypothetical protein